MRGLYVHVPFCVRKCRYCDFYSMPKSAAGGMLQIAAPDERYLAALEMELSRLPEDFRPVTTFVGGGTPTELDDAALDRLLARLARFRSDRLVEWTVESNPGTLTPAKARALKAAGVTRVSLGVQSFEPENLRFLGRIHSADEAVAGYELLRRTGFENVNLDLIFGIPGSSREALRRDLERAALTLRPEHISCYCLIFEPGTPLERMRAHGLVSEVDEEEERAQYEIVRETLGAAGYGQYEISNFARPGRECRHNLLYWGPGEYHGVGPSAASHVERRRFTNVRDLGAWCERLEGGESPVDADDDVRLKDDAWAREALVMALRRIDGVSRAEFRAATGHDPLDLAGREIDRFAGLGFIEVDGDRVRLTPEGLFVSDSVFAEVV